MRRSSASQRGASWQHAFVAPLGGFVVFRCQARGRRSSSMTLTDICVISPFCASYELFAERPAGLEQGRSSSRSRPFPASRHPWNARTKAADYRLKVGPGESATVRFRLTAQAAAELPIPLSLLLSFLVVGSLSLRFSFLSIIVPPRSTPSVLAPVISIAALAVFRHSQSEFDDHVPRATCEHERQ